MDKDFDAFLSQAAKASEDDAVELFDRALEACDIDRDDHAAVIALDKLPYFMAAYSQGLVYDALRKYHEWASS